MEDQQFEPSLAPKGVTSGQAQHLRNIDKKIRKQWNQLYCCRKVNTDKPQTQLKINQIKTQPSQVISKRNPHHIQQNKLNQQREITFQRIKKQNDIFFRKKRNEASSRNNLKSSSASLHQVSVHLMEERKNDSSISKKGKEVRLPLMLQKRDRRLVKQMSIIEFCSEENIRKIREKEMLKVELSRQQQERLVAKIKGTKLYYKFVQEWKTPLYQDDPHSHSSKL